MKPYKIPNINKQCVEKFQYVYPDSVMVENIKFYHVYLGLYIGEDINRELEGKELKGYGNVCIIKVMRIGHPRDKRWSNILFMYSQTYSTWDKETLEYYLKSYHEFLNVPEKFKDEIKKISIVLNKKDLDDEMNDINLNFDSLDETERLLMYCSSIQTIRLEKLHTFNKEPVDDWPDKNAFDVKFQFPITDDYIVCNGKVGTKICSDVYEFLDNLEYRAYRKGYDEDDELFGGRKPWYPHSLECGIYGLGKELWGDLDWSTRIFEGYSIRYATKNENSEDVNNLKDKYNLVFLSPNANNRKKEKKITEKCDRTEEDIINEYKEKGYTEVFEGAGFVGDWKIDFKKILDFKCLAKEIKGEICMLSDSNILLFKHSLKKTIQLNKQLLRYLRVELNDVGHTFIEETDENEIALFGEELVKHMKEAVNSGYF